MALNHNRKPIFYRITLFLLSMICVALLTFTAVALFFGGPTNLINTIKNLFTSNTPEVIVQVGEQEKKIKPLPKDMTKDLLTLLNRPSNSSTAMAILEAKQESQVKTILNKISYKPIKLKAEQTLDQSIKFSKQPSQVKLFLNFNGKDILSDSMDDFQSFNPGIDGPCYVLLEAYWPADKTWKTDRRGVYCFVINYDRPAELEFNSQQLDPGELLVIYAKYLTKDDKIGIQSDLPLSLQFAPYDNQTMVALAPLSCDLPAGEYDTTLTIGQNQHSFTININDKDFPSQLMTKEEGIIDISRHASSKSQYDDIIKPILEEKEANLLWSGPAISPIEDGDASTVFGVRCYIGDEATSTRHTGIDIPAKEGSAVKAINNGKVMFVGEFPNTGGLVIIEHGLGLKSWYFHLSENLVSVGDIVSKGDHIGNVGQAGSTHSYHLHLNLSVNNTYINPETALQGPLFR